MKKIILASATALGLSLIATGAFAGPGGGKHFDRMDKNGDGKITAEEMSEAHADLIAKADSDGDGAVTKEEMKAFHKARREEWKAKHNPDKNGDGVVDRTEFTDAAGEHFDKMDKDGDGVLSEDERKSRGRHHRRHGGR